MLPLFLMGEEVCNAADCALVPNPFVSAAFLAAEEHSPLSADLKDSRSTRRRPETADEHSRMTVSEGRP